MTRCTPIWQQRRQLPFQMVAASCNIVGRYVMNTCSQTIKPLERFRLINLGP